MISTSKYQHIIYFMSLLKVSLCIHRPKQVVAFMLRFSSYVGFSHRLWAFLLRLSPDVGLFHHVGAFLLPFSPCGGLFCLHVFFCLYEGGFHGLAPPPMIFFASAYYYVTYITCPPPSLTTAIVCPTNDMVIFYLT